MSESSPPMSNMSLGFCESALECSGRSGTTTLSAVGAWALLRSVLVESTMMTRRPAFNSATYWRGGMRTKRRFGRARFSLFSACCCTRARCSAARVLLRAVREALLFLPLGSFVRRWLRGAEPAARGWRQRSRCRPTMTRPQLISI